MKRINKKNLLIVFIIVYGIGIIGAFALLMKNHSEAQSKNKISMTPFSTKNSVKKDKIIGVISIDGPISYATESSSFLKYNCGARYWLEQMEIAATNEKIKAVVLRVNSPGGTVGTSEELYNAVKRIQAAGKPVVTSVVDLSASGGYYATVSSDYMFANAGSLVGSIGVIMGGLNFTDLMQKLGLTYQVVKSGSNKDILSPYTPLKEGQKQLLQSIIDDAYDSFLTVVADGRKLPKEKVKPFADGRVLTGKQALDAGLIDAIGDYVQAVEYIRTTYDLKDAALQPISPSSSLKFFDLISVAFGHQPKVELNLMENKFGYSPILYLYDFNF